MIKYFSSYFPPFFPCLEMSFHHSVQVLKLLCQYLSSYLNPQWILLCFVFLKLLHNITQYVYFCNLLFPSFALKGYLCWNICLNSSISPTSVSLYILYAHTCTYVTYWASYWRKCTLVSVLHHFRRYCVDQCCPSICSCHRLSRANSWEQTCWVTGYVPIHKFRRHCQFLSQVLVPSSEFKICHFPSSSTILGIADVFIFGNLYTKNHFLLFCHREILK